MNDQQNHPEGETPIDALWAEYLRRIDAGEPIDRDRFLADAAPGSDEIRDLLATADLVERLAGPFERPANPEETVDSGRSADQKSNAEDTFALAEVNIQKPPAPDSPHPPRGIDKLEPCEFGDYTLLEVIGRGGMGVVYKARQRGIDRVVAVKMIADGRLAADSDLHRFNTEAQAAGKLEHAGIVRIYQVGQVEGHHYFSMDFIEGTDLARLASEGPLESRRAARYMKEICDAIHFAHERDVLHRDLKPANVLIDEHDKPLVTDFGLAKQLDNDQNITASGAALGTPSYMSPEQAAGRTAAVGPTSDVYSLGAILYALLTGRPPFRGESTVETIFAVIHDNPRRPRAINPEVDRDLETICLRCLHKDPQRRYQSAQELSEDLQRYLGGDPIHARPVSAAQRAAYWLADVPIVAALIGRSTFRSTAAHRRVQGLAMLSLILLMVGFFSWRMGRQMLLPRKIVVSSGEKGQLYNDLCTDFAPVLEKVSGRRVEVNDSSGSQENVNLLRRGEAHLAIAQAELLTNEVVEIAPLYFDVVHVIARRQSPIETINDLANRRVAIGKEGSGMGPTAIKLLEICGVNPKSLLNSREIFTALESDLAYEAAIITTGFENPDRTRLLQSGDFRFVPFSDEQLARLQNSDFRPFTITANDVPEQIQVPSGGLRSVATTALLVVRADASERLVSTVLESLYHDDQLFENYKNLIPLHEAVTWRHAHWHPAAQEYYEEAARER